MRHRGILLLGLWASLLAGCLTGKAVQSTSRLSPFRPLRGLDGPDVVLLATYLLEGPVGDRFLDQELWTLADDQVLPLDHKALLEENGFRVAQVGGVLPSGLQTLLTSKRSCPDPRQIQQHADKPRRLSLGPV